MATAGTAVSATVGTLVRGQWYDAVVVWLEDAVRAGGPPAGIANLGCGRELAEVARVPRPQ